MAKYNDWKVGDKVVVSICGRQSTGVIESIEYDSFKDDWVADLDNGHWAYLSQIRRKAS